MCGAERGAPEVVVRSPIIRHSSQHPFAAQYADRTPAAYQAGSSDAARVSKLPNPSTIRLVYVHRKLLTVAERQDPLDECAGFDWDEANARKNWGRHRVTPEGTEGVFFNAPLVVAAMSAIPSGRRGFYALGQTSRGRYIFVAFTVSVRAKIRRKLIRVISVRDMNRREQEAYGNHEETSS